MNVLFITIAFPERPEERNIYTELMREIKDRGNNVYIVTSCERRFKKHTELSVENGLNVLRVKTGNLQKTNIVEKGIATLLVESQFIRAIKKNLSDIKFDLVIYSTPPVTFEKVVRYVKVRDNASSYLLLKDIFPQNAVDIGLIKKDGIFYKYFRKKEINLYKLSDYIGCMSQANVNYIIKHNPFINPNCVEVCPNSIRPTKTIKNDQTRKNIREKYGIPDDAVVFVYGGNLGKPQGIDFLIEVLESNRNKEGKYFLIVGSGTEYARLKQYLDVSNFKNAMLYPSLPKDDYDKLILACDVGMIFLDPRFTIPNFPSRMLTYMEFAMPVIAATDVNTDLGYVIRNGKFGFWSKSGDIEEFNNNMNHLYHNQVLREQMGRNARKYLENNYTVSKVYSIIMDHFEPDC